MKIHLFLLANQEKNLWTYSLVRFNNYFTEKIKMVVNPFLQRWYGKLITQEYIYVYL